MRVNIKMVVAFLAGSVAVYGLNMACTSSSTASADTDGGASDGGTSDAAFDAGVASDGGIPPYGDLPPGVEAENCVAITVPRTGPAGIDAGTDTIYVAEHAYPGKTKFEIAGHVTNWNFFPPGYPLPIPAGYETGIQAQLGIAIRDGFARVGCDRSLPVTFFVWR